MVFEWFGGNDGLNTIVPYGDPMYYKHRPTIGIKEKDVLKIDAQFGWHKSMRGMKHLYDEGKVAIVQGVGYDQPSFSHFTSMSFWHTAAPNSGNEYGWIGRTASALDPAGARAEHDREHLRQPDAGGEGARSTCRWCSSTRRGSSAACSRRRKPVLDALGARSTTPVGDAHKYVLEVTQERGAGVRGRARRVEPVQGQGQPGSAPARSRQGGGAHRSGLPDAGSTTCRCATACSTRTSTRRRRTTGSCEYCSDAIAGFFQEMKRIGRADDVVMYVHSEFGRRVPENTSLGTDHGTAQVNFVIGNAVKGGMYGTPPSLTNLVLGGNLESTTDFRQVYATLIEGWMGADAAKVLGQKFETLGMFRA